MIFLSPQFQPVAISNSTKEFSIVEKYLVHFLHDAELANFN